MVEESEIVFPDVMDCLSATKMRPWIQQQEQAEIGFPKDFDSIKNKYKTRQVFTDRGEELNIDSSGWVEPV